jgi:hypothetical protein
LTQLNRSFSLGVYQFQNAFGANYLQILAAFCTLVDDTVADVYRVFSTSTFIKNHILSEALFSEQVKALTHAFTLSTKKEFIRIFSLAC